MAVNGNGFFVLSEGGALSYTRSGDFGLDSLAIPHPSYRLRLIRLLA